MKNDHFIKYYRVYKNYTAVTDVSVNDLKPIPHSHFKKGQSAIDLTDVLSPTPRVDYSLPADDNMFYGYMDKVTAMEKAKAGALSYINKMITEVEQGIKKLVQYRNDH